MALTLALTPPRGCFLSSSNSGSGSGSETSFAYRYIIHGHSGFTSINNNNNNAKYLLPRFRRKSTFSVSCSINQQGAAGENLPHDYGQQQSEPSKGFWDKWKANSTEMKAKLAKLGLAAVLAYGLFDGVTYTTFFVLSFLGYEKSTGKNPAANLQALLGIVILMWTGNNITRPFRVAGAAALAPLIDRGLKRIQNHFKFPNVVYAFALVVSAVATCCFTVVGLLILSRWP